MRAGFSDACAAVRKGLSLAFKDVEADSNKNALYGFGFAGGHKLFDILAISFTLFGGKSRATPAFLKYNTAHNYSIRRPSGASQRRNRWEQEVWEAERTAGFG